MLANMPAEAAPRRVPCERTVSPGFTSSPARRMASPSRTARNICTSSSETLSVSSTSTTASAPSGIGAPVMILMASPGPSAAARHDAGLNLLDHSQRPGRLPARAPHVFRAQGVAVHRRVVPGRNGTRGLDVLGQHPAGTIEQAHPVRAPSGESSPVSNSGRLPR